MGKIKSSTTSKIRFYDVDAEMFRRTLVDMAKSLVKDMATYEDEVMSLKKKALAENDKEKFSGIQSDIFWAENWKTKARDKIFLLDEILQDIGFRLTDYGSLKMDLKDTLQTSKGEQK